MESFAIVGSDVFFVNMKRCNKIWKPDNGTYFVVVCVCALQWSSVKKMNTQQTLFVVLKIV